MAFQGPAFILQTIVDNLANFIYNLIAPTKTHSDFSALIETLREGNAELEESLRINKEMLAIKARADGLNNLYRLAKLDPRKNPLPHDFEAKVQKLEEDWEAMREAQKKTFDLCLVRIHKGHGKGCSGEVEECMEYESKKIEAEMEEEDKGDLTWQ